MSLDDRGRPDIQFFDATAMGWLLRLLFFPSGVITLLLVALLLKRGQLQDKQSDSKSMSPRSHVAQSVWHHQVDRMCVGLEVGRQRQRDLEICGRIDSNSCGYCLGECWGHMGYVQLPCGHFHHARCVRRALRVRIWTCADCGDVIVNDDKICPADGSRPPNTV